MPKTKNQPSQEDLRAIAEEAYAENRKAFAAARQLARKIFPSPDVQTVLGVSEALANCAMDAGLAESYFQEALRVAAVYDKKATPADVLAIGEILMNDELAEKHLAVAAADAREGFGEDVNLDMIVTVYFEIYTDKDGNLYGVEE